MRAAYACHCVFRGALCSRHMPPAGSTGGRVQPWTDSTTLARSPNPLHCRRWLPHRHRRSQAARFWMGLRFEKAETRPTSRAQRPAHRDVNNLAEALRR